MGELWDSETQRFIQGDLLRRVRKVIVTADYMGDLHLSVVNHHHIVVDGHPRRTNDNWIADDLVGKLDVPAHDVVKTDGMLRDFQTNRRCLPCYLPTLRLCRVEPPTFSRVDRLAILGER